MGNCKKCKRCKHKTCICVRCTFENCSKWCKVKCTICTKFGCHGRCRPAGCRYCGISVCVGGCRRGCLYCGVLNCYGACRAPIVFIPMIVPVVQPVPVAAPSYGAFGQPLIVNALTRNYLC